MLKLVFAGLTAWAIMFLIIVQLVPKDTSFATPEPQNKLSGIIRLHDAQSGRFFCSGVVVDRRTLFTAGHCTPGMIAEVRAADGKPTGIIVRTKGAQERGDVGIMRGDLRRFAPVKFSVDPGTILNNIESNKRKIMACGFPWGGPMLCVPVTDRHQAIFQIGGRGYLYPGMSGGPVIDQATGTVIGVNSRVTETEVVFSPLINIYEACNVKP